MFYTMGEVTEMFDVNSSLIRYWESHFSVIKPVRNKKGNRLFTPKDIENFKLIYHLVKERGMTLEGAKKSLKGGKIHADREVELMDRLLNMRALLLEVREVLKEGDASDDVEEVESDKNSAPLIDIDAVAEPRDDSEQISTSQSTTQPSRKGGESSEERELFAFYEQNLF